MYPILQKGLFKSALIIATFFLVLNSELKAQNLEWVHLIKTTDASTFNSGQANSLCYDESNNVYLVFETDATTGLDLDPVNGGLPITVASNTMVLVKFSANGNLLWYKTIEGDINNVKDIDYSNGQVYIVGSYDGTVDFDPGAGVQSLTSTGGYDAFILNLDSSGAFSWVGSPGTSGNSEYERVIVDDANSRIIVTGFFTSTLDADPGAGTVNITSKGSTDLFFTSFDVAGNHIWTVNGGGNSNERCRGIDVDANGNIYVSGYIGNSATSTFDYNAGAGSISANGFGGNDILYLKISSIGEVLEYQLVGTSSNEIGNRIRYNAFDSTVIIGGFFSSTIDFDLSAGESILSPLNSNDGFLLKLDAQTSDFENVYHFSGVGTIQPWAMDIDDNGNTVLTGKVNGYSDLNDGKGNYKIVPQGGNDIYFASVSHDFKFNWGFDIGGDLSDSDLNMVVDNDNNLLSIGRISDSVDFEIGSGEFFVDAGAQFEGLYLVKYSNLDTIYDEEFPPVITSLSSYSADIGTTLTITGENFDPIAANNTVNFGATKADVISASPTQLQVEVPIGATFDAVSVNTQNGTGYSDERFSPSFEKASAFSASSYDAAVNIGVGPTPYYLQIGDLDNDGLSDLVVDAGGSNYVRLMRNTGSLGSPAFTAVGDLVTGTNPNNIILDDIDGDGAKDIIVTNYAASTISIFRNIDPNSALSTSSFDTKFDLSVNSNGNDIGFRDLDMDGKPELVVTNYNANSIQIFKNQSSPGDLSINTFTPTISLSTLNNPSGIEFADFDNDGILDIVISHAINNSISVFRNTSTPGVINSTSINSRSDFNVGTFSGSVDIGDFDGDGKVDIAIASNPTSSVRIVLNTSSGPGNINFSAAFSLTAASGANVVRVTDLDGDSQLDLACSNTGSSLVSVFHNVYTSGTMDASSFDTYNYTVDTDPHGLVIGDVDNDSLPDIISSNITNNTISILRRQQRPCLAPDLPVFNATDSICSSDSSWIKVDGGSLNDANNWKWYTGSCGGTLIGKGDSILVSSNSDFTVYVRGEGGCITSPGACTSQNVVIGNTGTVVDAIASDTIICFGDAVTLTGVNANNYQWTGGISNGQTIVSTEPGPFIYYVTGTDDFGCSSLDSASFFVLPASTEEDKGKFIGSGFESYIPVYFPCDLSGTDSALYTFNTSWLSILDIFAYAFAPFSGGCPSTASINQSFDAYEGISSLRMDADTIEVKIASLTGSLAGRPNSLKGYMKFNGTSTDTAYVIAGVVPEGTNVNTNDSSGWSAYGAIAISGPVNTYTEFQVPFTYSDNNPIDSFAINILMSNSSLQNISVWWDAFELVYDTTEIDICSGDSVFAGGAWQTTSGIYTDNTTTAFGCDSTSILKVNVVPGAIVDAGIDQSYCADITSIPLNGSFSNAVSAVWDGGVGSFSPNANDPNASYTPTPAEIASGSLKLAYSTAGPGQCSEQSDTVEFTFDPLPDVDAGPDLNLCANAGSVNISANLTNATGLIWSGGSGSFNPSNTSTNPSYTPSAAELNAGLVSLLVSTTGNGTCSAASDTLVITIDSLPVVDAGVDETICETDNGINLGASFSGSSGVTWSGGTGTYSPDAQNPNAFYTPSAAEYISGIVNLTLTSTGNGACPAANDTKTIFINSLPVVDAGPDQSVCADGTIINLSGSVTNASGGIWSGGSGSFSPSNTNLIASYTPSSLDISNGQVELILSSTGSVGCPNVSDTINIAIQSPPTVDAGPDFTECADVASVTTTATFTNATGLSWTSLTGTVIANPNLPSISFTPSASELSNGFTELIVETTGNGNCNAAVDTIRINYTPVPTVDAGQDTTVCVSVSSINLNGIFSGSTGVIWTGGSGTFSSNTDPLASYTPSAVDTAAGFVELILTSTGTGACAPVSDTVLIGFDPAPSPANAGPNQDICGLTTVLGANFPGVGIGTWTQISGPGTINFSNITDPLANINASQAGAYTLQWTTSNGSCPDNTDQVQIAFNNLPIAQIDTNGILEICQGESITLNTLSPGSGSYGYQWLESNIAIAGANASSLTVSTTGSYSVAIVESGSFCADTSQIINVNVNPRPTVSGGADTAICIGDVIQLFGTGAVNYDWDNGITDGVAFSPTLTTTYTVIGFDANNCADTASVIVTVNDLPIINLGLDTTLCSNFNETVTLDPGSGFQDYLWSDGSINPTLFVDEAFNIANGDLIWVDVTDANNCVGRDSINVFFTICGAIADNVNLLDRIYPNPTNGDLSIELKENYSGIVKITDLRGATLLEEEFSGKIIDLDLRAFPSSEYIIEIQSEKGIIKSKIIKH